MPPKPLAYTVPPFNATPPKRFSWWLWHPSHDQKSQNGWRESSWKGATEKEAAALASQLPHSNHCKLMLEQEFQYVEVIDRPPLNPDQWHEYKANVEARAARGYAE